ncbi:MAG: type II toxin-antitoxin system RelE/ParE family toxin [Bryobacteraceae bacterium]
MDLAFRFAPEVQGDLREAFQWYEQARPGLGERFLLAVEDALDFLAAKPQIYARVFEDCRRAFVRGFPYSIYYEQVGDHIFVYGILHSARDAKNWQKRITGR